MAVGPAPRRRPVDAGAATAGGTGRLCRMRTPAGRASFRSSTAWRPCASSSSAATVTFTTPGKATWSSTIWMSCSRMPSTPSSAATIAPGVERPAPSSACEARPAQLEVGLGVAAEHERLDVAHVGDAEDRPVQHGERPRRGGAVGPQDRRAHRNAHRQPARAQRAGLGAGDGDAREVGRRDGGALLDRDVARGRRRCREKTTSPTAKSCARRLDPDERRERLKVRGPRPCRGSWRRRPARAGATSPRTRGRSSRRACAARCPGCGR